MLSLDPEATEEPTTTDEPRPRRPSEPLVPGDRYRIGEVIARGGMGEVITAFDGDIGRDVAIKRLRAPNPTPHAVARFLREARIQGRLDHPAIVPVYELAYDDAGRPFFAMKKLSGITLAAILGAGAPGFTRQRLLRAFADVCLAIELAHTRGVIHRDLKPANIVLGDFGEVYVLDWGIACVPTDRDPPSEPDPADDERATEVVTRTGTAVGTRGYMAPEQAAGQRVDSRADVYSLGCMLFEILTRTRYPNRPGVTWADPRPALHASGAAPELIELCVWATAPDRATRLDSARALGEAVQRYLDGDRDVELRAKLARAHLDRALDAGDDEAGRRTAMREAGQALALDPMLGEAAELIGRLMIEPPKLVPAQVIAELEAVDRVTARRFVWNLLAVHFSFIALLPVMWALGVRDAFYGGAVALVAVAGIVVGIVELRARHRLLAVQTVLMVLTFALLARMFTPFLIAPFAVAVNVVAFAFHPDARRERAFWIFTASSIAAVIGVFLLEYFGVVSRTMVHINGALVLSSPIEGFGTFPAIAALAITFTLSTLTSAALARSTARFAFAARNRVHLQAWQVRQLVPDR